jgi:hypothetical protein
MTGKLPSSVIQQRTEPPDRPTSCINGSSLRQVFMTREVTDRGPDSKVLGVLAELFKSESAIGPRKDINATIRFKRLVTREDGPGPVEPR